MPVHFHSSRDEGRGPRMMRVFIPKAMVPFHIIIGCNQIYWRSVSMHFDVELGRQVPCLNAECIYCPKPTREVTYVPCLLAQGASPAGRFQPRIVPVTDGWADILDGNHERDVFKVQREAKNATCRWSIATTLATYNLTPYQGQEIEPTLFRMWGVKK